MSNPFGEHDPAADNIPGKVRHTLARMDMENETVLRIIQACRDLKLKIESPCWRGESGKAIAQIGIPAMKIAIRVMPSYGGLATRKAVIHNAWTAEGWKCLFPITDSLDGMPQETVAKHLLEALHIKGEKK
jgi:hypothetical protein